MNEFLKAAIELAERGFPVLPLTPRGKTPITKNGVKDATTDITQIKQWWIRSPKANIGLAVGVKAGIFGIDIDYKDGCDVNFLKKLPPTIFCSTPSGGHHAYFKIPENGIKNGLVLEKGATIRSDGYYFVVPPSIHPNGKPYVWGLVQMADVMVPVHE